MTTRLLTTALIFAALGGTLPQGAAAEGDPAFMRHLYPPELVMRNQGEIGLTDDQRKAITRAIHDTQGSVLDLQWSMQEAAKKLGELLAAERVDRDAALAQVGRVLDLEQQVKKAHIGLLIQIKNQLDSEQRRQLDALRPDELSALIDLL